MEKPTVCLTAAQKRALARVAKASGRREADLIRQGIEAVTSRHRAARLMLPLFESRRPDLAERVDDYLNGFGER